ncbi:hypothetical protein FNV43_RR14208 [Rhamnella rubrinervis]|uniref:Uncharacterized protein n=1 Tax=Rhamnella rubrinervis TaxID=2594499 RepID=A0A8K0MG10_9ROSA|nr:hypothetical protein FNV43_RR14208 [Rhamnella rubrinervis]
MKREGRQHGMVRTHRILPSPLNPRPSTRFVNQFDSPTTAGLFAKVSSKPTNHSKFTGKCGQPRCAGCHLHPACKSKDKTKGTHKTKSSDVVVEGRQRLNFSGYSATGILDQLSGHCVDDDHDHDDDDSAVNEHDGSYGDGNVVQNVSSDPIKSNIETINEDGDHGNDDDDVDDDPMSFCNVGYALDQVEGDEDWCLVGEM